MATRLFRGWTLARYIQSSGITMKNEHNMHCHKKMNTKVEKVSSKWLYNMYAFWSIAEHDSSDTIERIP
jgi:hypothetical protein